VVGGQGGPWEEVIPVEDDCVVGYSELSFLNTAAALFFCFVVLRFGWVLLGSSHLGSVLQL
jgi:hypothetical protein